MAQKDLFDNVANEVQAKVATEYKETKTFFEKPIARYMVMAFGVIILGMAVFAIFV